MGRLGTPEEVADVIVFIASPRAHWINGRNIPADGLEQPYGRSTAGHTRSQWPLFRQGPIAGWVGPETAPVVGATGGQLKSEFFALRLSSS
jgi:hypothetical protein